MYVSAPTLQFMQVNELLTSNLSLLCLRKIKLKVTNFHFGMKQFTFYLIIFHVQKYIKGKFKDNSIGNFTRQIEECELFLCKVLWALKSFKAH
jgi:hypothetical protein